MATEELKVKISVDTSDVDRAKKKINNLEDANKQGVNDTTDAVKSLTDAVGQLKQIDFTKGIRSNLDKIKSFVISINNAFDSIQKQGIDLNIDSTNTSILGTNGQEKEQVKEPQKALDNLGRTMEKIKKIGFLDIILENLDSLKKNIDWVKIAFQVLNPKDKVYTEGGAPSGLTDRLVTFKESLKNVSNETEKFINNMEKGWGGLKKVWEKLFANGGIGAQITVALGAIAVYIMAVVAAVKILIASCKKAIEISKLGREITISAQKAGLSTKAYQEWAFMFERVGIEADKLRDALKSVAAKQAEAIKGTQSAVKAFKSLGISMEQVASMSREELFEKVINQLQQIENTTTRVSYAFDIFGENAVELAGILNLTVEETEELLKLYKGLGAAMDKELIDKSNKLQASSSSLKLAWQGLSNTLGGIFMPIVTAVNKALTKLIALINYNLKAIINFNKKKIETDTLNGIGENAETQIEKIEDLKRSMMGFDELNVVQNPNNDESSSSSEVGVGDLNYFTPESLGLTDLEGWVKETSPKLLLFISSMYTALTTPFGQQTLGEIGALIAHITLIGNNIDTIKEKFNSFKNKVTTTFIDVKNAVSNAGKKMAKDLKESWQNVKNAYKDTKEFFKKKFDEAWAAVTETWDKAKTYFSNKWDDIKTAFKDVKEELGKRFREAWDKVTEIWNNAKSYFSGIWDGIKERYAEIKSKLASFFIDAWNKVTEKWDKAKSYFGSIWDGIKEKYAEIKTKLAEFFINAWNKITETWSKATSFFGDIWLKIKNTFSSVGTTLGGFFSTAWENVKKAFSNVSSFFTGVWNTIKSIFSSIGSSIGSAVSNAFSSAVNWVLRNAVNIINGFIRTINSVVGVINLIPGVSIGNVRELDVPQLAVGGIVTKSTLANIGENGTEAVLPLQNNTGWMDILADRIASRNKESAPTKVVLQVGERELGWATINGINQITRQTGALQLTI